MRRHMSGFTLIELILVMALIGILAVVGIGSYTQATIKSKDTQRKNDLYQIARALESFNNDVGRYPKINNDVDLVITCPNAVKTEISCNSEIYAYIGDVKSTYMKDVPSDPNIAKKYVYVPAVGEGGFSLYAALENLEDKDVVTSGGAVTDWGISCGSVNCNYKITETGLIRTR